MCVYVWLGFIGLVFSEVVQAFILSGVVADTLEFPHMARVGLTADYEQEPEYLCGGSLISEQYVLTTAHCMHRDDLRATHVQLAGENGALEEYNVIEVIKHPEYMRNWLYNDIALLKLEKRVVFTKYLKPACLHRNKEIPHTTATACGYGTGDVKGISSDKLLKTQLPLMPHYQCTKTYPLQLFRNNMPRGLDAQTMVCAGGTCIGNDTCQGDSGGPLQVETIACKNTIIGLTSFGIGCGINPGVYTRVSHYVPWIQRVIHPQVLYHGTSNIVGLLKRAH